MNNRMKTEDFNRMLRSVRDMLAKYHEGVTFDPATVQWAQELVAANPVDKRRPTPKTDKLMDLYVDPANRKNGLTFDEMAATLGEKPNRNSARVKLVSKLCMQRKMFSARDRKCARYFVTAAERDAWRGTPKAKPEQPPKIPRLAKTARPRQHVKKAEPTQEPKPAAKLTTPKTSNNRVNPDQGGAWAPKPKVEPPSPTIDPNDPRIQRAEFKHDTRYSCAPGERPFGAGFSAMPIGYSPVTGRPW